MPLFECVAQWTEVQYIFTIGEGRYSLQLGIWDLHHHIVPNLIFHEAAILISMLLHPLLGLLKITLHYLQVLLPFLRKGGISRRFGHIWGIYSMQEE